MFHGWSPRVPDRHGSCTTSSWQGYGYRSPPRGPQQATMEQFALGQVPKCLPCLLDDTISLRVYKYKCLYSSISLSLPEVHTQSVITYLGEVKQYHACHPLPPQARVWSNGSRAKARRETKGKNVTSPLFSFFLFFNWALYSFTSTLPYKDITYGKYNTIHYCNEPWSAIRYDTGRPAGTYNRKEGRENAFGQ